MLLDLKMRDNDEMIGMSYQHTMRSLMYVMWCTQQDLTYSISGMNQHMANGQFQMQNIGWLLNALFSNCKIYLKFRL